MKRREVVTLIIWLAFSIFICIESWRLDIGTIRVPGPGFFPFVASLIIGIFVLAQLFIWKGRRQTSIGYIAPFFQAKRLRELIYMVWILFCFPLLLSQLGFFLCTLLFIGLSLKMIEPQKWKVVLGISFVVAILTYLLFEVLLNIQLPKGMLLDRLFQK